MVDKQAEEGDWSICLRRNEQRLCYTVGKHSTQEVQEALVVIFREESACSTFPS